MKIIIRIKNNDFYKCYDYIVNHLGGKRLMINFIDLKYFYFYLEYKDTN